jgi:chloride channel protein, CIC family
MTSVIMIFEVTRDYTIIVPLMITNLCSYVLAQRFQKVPIYEALSLQEGIKMPSPEHLPEPLTADTAMRSLSPDYIPVTPLPTVHPDDPLDAALQLMGRARVDELLVVSRMGDEPVGLLSRDDVLRAYQRLAARGRPHE